MTGRHRAYSLDARSRSGQRLPSPAKTASTQQLNPSEVRRKRSDQPVKIGSVVMEGQLMRINIFKSEYQPVHRLSKYWYTVESKSSPYYKRASVIYSELHRLRRHTYRVRVNHDTENPQILG